MGARDEFIAIIANRLAKVCRADSMLARIDSDSFAILSLTAQPQEAGLLAGRLRAALQTPVALAETQIPVACQIGTSVTQLPLPASHLIYEACLAALQSRADGPAMATVRQG